MLRVVSLTQKPLHILVSVVLQVIKELDSTSLQIQPKALLDDLVYLLVYGCLMMPKLQNALQSLTKNGVSLLYPLKPLGIALKGYLQLLHRFENVLDTVMVSDEECLIQLFVEVGHKVVPGFGEYLKGEILH